MPTHRWRTRLAARRIAWVSASGKHVGGATVALRRCLRSSTRRSCKPRPLPPLAVSRLAIHSPFCRQPRRPDSLCFFCRVVSCVQARQCACAARSANLAALRPYRLVVAQCGECVQLLASALNDDKDHFQADPATADDYRHDPLHSSARLPRVRRGVACHVACSAVWCHVACPQRVRLPVGLSSQRCTRRACRSRASRSCSLPRLRYSL